MTRLRTPTMVIALSTAGLIGLQVDPARADDPPELVVCPLKSGPP